MTEGEQQPIYVNWVRFGAGPFDLLMDFGYRVPEPEDREAEPEPSVSVVMSLSHAKSMLPLLARVIAEYENQAGPVPAPGFDEFGKS